MPKHLLKTLKVILLILVITSFQTLLAKPKSELIQLIVYHFKSDSQLYKTETYLKNALLPALHQKKINRIGVFKPVDFIKDKRLILVVPFQSFREFEKISEALKKDNQYLEAGKIYLQATHKEAPYERMETIFLNAFSTAPILKKPNLSGSVKDKIYELRSYESATEELHKNKVKMFNEGGETAIFSKLQFNPIFYGSVIAGSKMPNLMYMTSFNNMEDRNAHWKAFGSDPDWKVLSAQSEYKNNVSKIETTYLNSTDYSDL